VGTRSAEALRDRRAGGLGGGELQAAAVTERGKGEDGVGAVERAAVSRRRQWDREEGKRWRVAGASLRLTQAGTAIVRVSVAPGLAQSRVIRRSILLAIQADRQTDRQAQPNC
jgi:hypothetical protein